MPSTPQAVAVLDPAAAPRAAPAFTAHQFTRDLKRSSVRGAAVTGASQFLKFGLRFGSTAVLARLLSPEDYGLVAMTTVITGFVALFKDAGLTSATVQRDDITHDQISTLFWINTGVGCLIALLLAALAPAVAAFYHEPRLQPITLALATTFIFGGLTVQHQALLRREMRFTALAALDIASIAVGVVVAIAMASAGFGYWALVGLNVAIAVVSAVGVWLMLRWVPGAPRRRCGVKPLLKFGTDVLSFNVVNYFSRQSDTLLIGWFWGPAALGFYDKAYNMLLLPIRQINAPLAAVAVPALARARADAGQFRRFYLNSLQLVTSISVPLVLVIALFADPLVYLWLGPGWGKCAELFRLLALAAGIGAISNPIGWLLISLGHTQRYKQMGWFSSGVTVLSFVIGLPFGARGVATAYSLATLLLLVPTWLFVLKDTGIRGREISRTLMPPLVSCVPAALTALAALRFVPALGTTLLPAAVGVVSFMAVYAYTLLVHYGRWAFFRDILQQFKRSRTAR